MSIERKGSAGSLRFRYGNAVAVLPAAVSDALDRATKQDLKILILVAADPAMQADPEGELDAFCRWHKLEASAVQTALAYWRGVGILEQESEEDAAAAQETEVVSAAEPSVAAQPSGRTRGKSQAAVADASSKSEPEAAASAKKLARSEALPTYTTGELATLLESRPGAAEFLDLSQQTIGKIFNTHEINVLMGLLDYLELREDYVLQLLTYCASIGKKSLHYIEKMAFGLYDEGVRDVEVLTERLRVLERARELEGQIRALFGMGERALTKKEKNCITEWVGTYGYDIEVIRMAYEETISGTSGTPSVPYAHAILTRWYGEGLKSAADVESAQNKEKEARGGDSSFDADSFFEEALRRSYQNEE